MADLANPPYPPPLDQLLTLGEAPARARDWPDYLALGLREEHVPALIRMSADQDLWFSESDCPEAYAPIHAWRALGQLRAQAAIEPLLTLLDESHDDDDWIFEEIPIVLGMIGPAAIPPLAAYMADAENDVWFRIAAARALKLIALDHPEAREDAVAPLLEEMGKWEEGDDDLTTSLVSNLVDLRVMEAVPLIEQAFAAERVDVFMRGDWEDVQVDLGLIPERLTPPQKRGWTWDFSSPGERAQPAAPSRGRSGRPGSGKAKARARRKAARESRRRNRSRR